MILIVNDDELVIEMLRDILGESNCIEAYDGAQALALWLANRETVQRIITDYQMPRMDGREFVLAVRQIDKQIPITVFSTAPNVERIFAGIDVTIAPIGITPATLLRS